MLRKVLLKYPHHHKVHPIKIGPIQRKALSDEEVEEEVEVRVKQKLMKRNLHEIEAKAKLRSHQL